LKPSHFPPYAAMLKFFWDSEIFLHGYKLNPDPRTSSEFGLGRHEIVFSI
jgi:hypothetical protein